MAKSSGPPGCPGSTPPPRPPRLRTLPQEAHAHLVLGLPFPLANVVSHDPLRFLAESGEVRQLSGETDPSVNTEKGRDKG